MTGTLAASINFKFIGSLSRILLPSSSSSPYLTHSLRLRQPRIVSSYSTLAMDSYSFGPYKISPSEVFYSTQLSYAMVNLRPVVPGHVLVCPMRDVKRFADLSSEETVDLWLSAQKIGKQLEQYHNASSLTFTIQDGPQAGQTVPHVHIHILPRKANDFANNDEIYDAIDSKETELKQKLDLDKERIDRTSEEMAEEAASYKKLFDRLT